MTDPASIEREIAAERAGLERKLQELDARLAPERLVNDASDIMRDHATSAARGAVETAKDNPLAFALIGTGVAWLIAGSQSGAAASGADDPTPPPPVPTYDPTPRATAPGLRSARPSMAGFDDRVAAADRKLRQAQSQGDDTMSMASAPHSPDQDTQTSGWRARVGHSAAAMRDRLEDGLGDLPQAVRARILSARIAAIDAQARVEAQIQRGSVAMRKRSEDNPLGLGLIAFGLGAALGAALPRTDLEDHTLGARRDQLIDDADRMFREETAKLKQVAEAAITEGKSAVKDTLQSGPPTEDDPAARISEAASKEAKRQGVGQSS